MISGRGALLDVEMDGDFPLAAFYYGRDRSRTLATLASSSTHQRSFLSRLSSLLVEYSCTSADGEFLWRLFGERRGFSSGLLLSMAETDEEAERWKEPLDPLWTVGTLGREHQSSPTAAGDPRTAWFRRASSEPRFRLVIEDDSGELWGTLARAPWEDALQLVRWDGLVLGELALSSRDDVSAEFLLSPGQDLNAADADLLELSVFESVGLAALMLGLGTPS